MIRNSNSAAVVVVMVLLLSGNWTLIQLWSFLKFVVLLCDVSQEATSNISLRGGEEEKREEERGEDAKVVAGGA